MYVIEKTMHESFLYLCSNSNCSMAQSMTFVNGAIEGTLYNGNRITKSAKDIEVLLDYILKWIVLGDGIFDIFELIINPPDMLSFKRGEGSMPSLLYR